MENKTPCFDNKTIKDITLLKRFIGKKCLLSFVNNVIFPFTYSTGTSSLEAIIQECDESYLIVKSEHKKKYYISALDINNIIGITLEE